MKKSFYLSSLLVLCCSLFSIKSMAQAPVITTEPANDTVCTGSSTIFHIAAMGADPVTYMWEYSADGGAIWDTVHDGTVYTGADNDTLTVTSSLTLNGVMYRCMVFDLFGDATSMSATLTVDGTSAGTISGGTGMCVGGSISLSSTVSGGIWSNVDHAIDTTTPAGLVTGLAHGTDVISYTLTNTCGTYTSTLNVTVDTALISAPITGPTAVCVGSTIVISNAISGGTWTNANSNAAISSFVTPTITVTGVTGGLDTIYYSRSNACNAVSATKYITVETLPVAGTVTGPTAVCAGDWIHLVSSITGGVWISGAASVAVVNTSGFVTGLTAGTSIISYYQSNSCGASFGSLAVTVTAPAAPIVGYDGIGVDSMRLYTNLTPGGTWSSTNTSAVTIDAATGMATGIAFGTTTIIYDVTNACGTSAASRSVSVGALPNAGTIYGPDSVCIGSTIILTGTQSGYTWTDKRDTLTDLNPTSPITDSTIAVTGLKYGLDTIYHYVGNIYGVSKAMKKVFVNTAPIINITGPGSVSLGGGYMLTATPTGGTWTENNPAMSPLIGYGFFVVLDTGTATYTYTVSNGCGTSTKPFSIHLAGVNSVNTVGEGAAKFNVYPNPSNGAVTVNIATPTNEQVSVVLMNIAGQVVKEFKAMSNVPTDLRLDQPAGIYLLSAITADGNRHSARITINN